MGTGAPTGGAPLQPGTAGASGGLPPSTSSGGGARDRRGTAEPAPAWVASGHTDLLQLGGLHLGAGGVLKSLQRLSRAPPSALLLISHWPRWALGL